MSPLLACIIKELRLLRRDVHGLALMFLLPLAFILLMSLALQDLFAARGGHLADVLLVDRDATPASAALRANLAKNEAFGVTAPARAPADLRSELLAGRYAFAVEIRKGYGASLEGMPQAEAPTLLAVTVAPDTDKRTETLMLAALGEAAGLQRTEQLIGFLPTEDPFGYPIDPPKVEATPIDVAYAYQATPEVAPTAVQQSVPAWLVFAVFFVAIPFSNTFIRERELGVQRRLRTIDVDPWSQFLGKLIPYFAVNQLQVAAMLAAGVFLVPLLGGQALQMNGSPLALVMLSAAISLAALGLALLIAVVARTTEQATLTAGLSALLLAAIGGIMVPKFVMPQGMQALAAFSPMAWGLDGFLDLLLRGGGVGEIADELAKLAGFGAAALGLAWLVHRYRE